MQVYGIFEFYTWEVNGGEGSVRPRLELTAPSTKPVVGGERMPKASESEACLCVSLGSIQEPQSDSQMVLSQLSSNKYLKLPSCRGILSEGCGGSVQM